MLPQALAGISLSLFSSRYKCFRRPSQVSLFLFSLFSLPVQKRNVRHGRSRPQTLQMLPQPLAGISLSLFSFLFTGSKSNVRQGRSHLQTLQMLPQALPGISLSLFSFLFTGSESNVRQGRSRPQTLQMLPQPLQVSLFLFSLFSLPVRKATLGTAGPALKRYKCFRRPKTERDTKPARQRQRQRKERDRDRD